MAELELSVLFRQCLDRRIENKELLVKEVTAWNNERNENKVAVTWQFTTADARIKLHKLYPTITSGSTTKQIRINIYNFSSVNMLIIQMINNLQE